MAGLVIQRCHDRFPAGTVVQARAESKVALHSRGSGNKLAGAALASATVQPTVPHLAFSGLPPETPLVLTGVVGGQLRRLHAMSEAA